MGKICSNRRSQKEKEISGEKTRVNYEYPKNYPRRWK